MTTPDFGASHSLNALYDAVPETSLAAYRGRRIVIPAPSYQFLTKTGEIDHARREAALGNLEALGARADADGRGTHAGRPLCGA